MTNSVLIPLFSLCLFALGSAQSVAKRVAPKPVEPVIYEGVRYAAPATFDRGWATIEAHDARSGKFLWRVQVPRTDYRPGMEKDVEEIFIKDLLIDRKHNQLVVVPERGPAVRLVLYSPQLTANVRNGVSNRI